jgi:hypothetical protein
LHVSHGGVRNCSVDSVKDAPHARRLKIAISPKTVEKSKGFECY